MKRSLSLVVALLSAVVLAACSQPSVATCSDNADCPSASLCVQGICQGCAPGLDACSGVCLDTHASDPSNCGGCGVACLASQTCTAGACLDHLLIVTGGVATASVADVQANLAGTGAFAIVDTFDASVPTARTPTLAELRPYSVVLTFTDASDGFGYANPTLMGDNLATYFEAGGRVVTATFANTTSLALGGRFATQYMLITVATQSQPTNSTLGTIAEPDSPLLAGVTSFGATQAYGSSGAVKNGGIAVASWSDGRPLVVRGIFGDRQRADLNFYPPSSALRSDFWTGNGTELMRNALLFK